MSNEPALFNHGRKIAPIFYIVGGGLGDLWVSVQFLLHESVYHGRPARVHFMSQSRDITEMIPRICALIDCPGGSIEVTQEMATEHMHPHQMWWKAERYFPLKKPWKPTGSKIICHQFNGKSAAHMKNPPPEDIPFLTGWAPPGYTFKALGLPMTIEETAAALADCAMFMGICSGVALVAHSARVPTVLTQYHLELPPWHGGNFYALAYGTQDAIEVSKIILQVQNRKLR